MQRDCNNYKLSKFENYSYLCTQKGGLQAEVHLNRINK